VPRLFDAAHAHGLSVSIDTNYDPSEQWDSGLADVLPHTDIFLPNETELLAITHADNLDTAFQRLPPHLTVAVKLGARGGLARRGPESAHADVIPVEVADTTGAGDSFDAGFLYGHLAGWELARALRFASICGSLSTRASGGTSAQATLVEALVYM
jgi:sugar/nucleoside kinase (ribokinase family)